MSRLLPPIPISVHYCASHRAGTALPGSASGPGGGLAGAPEPGPASKYSHSHGPIPHHVHQDGSAKGPETFIKLFECATEVWGCPASKWTVHLLLSEEA